MPITPIDIKTQVVGSNEASRMREAQKAGDQGAAVQPTQNQDKLQEKVDTLQQSDAAEGRVLRKEDEENEKKKEQPDTPKRVAKPGTEEPPPAGPAPIPDPDGLRGLKVDLKA